MPATGALEVKKNRSLNFYHLSCTLSRHRINNKRITIINFVHNDPKQFKKFPFFLITTQSKNIMYQSIIILPVHLVNKYENRYYSSTSAWNGTQLYSFRQQNISGFSVSCEIFIHTLLNAPKHPDKMLIFDSMKAISRYRIQNFFCGKPRRESTTIRASHVL